jgi:glycosyltransferase involved in cell wall biosynthesis
MNPIVSVIIPNYNHAPFLKERIESVLNQSFQDFEVILLDDCSTDNSRDIIEQYRHHPRVSNIIFNEQNTGNTFVQWERGISLARGKYIWIAESDDVAEKNFLSTLIPLLEADEQCVVAYSHSLMIDSNGQPMQQTWHKKGSNGSVIIHDGSRFNRQVMVNHCAIYNASMTVFRKSVFPLIPKDFQNFRYCGDWLFWGYVCQHGKVIEVCQKLNRLRRHENEVSSRAEKNGAKWQDTGGILSRFIDIMQLSPWECRCMRGRWTKRFRKERFPNKEDIKNSYPHIFDGSLLDVVCYEVGKLSLKVSYTGVK